MKWLLLLIGMSISVTAHPAGAPLTDYGPAKMALGLYFDHSGQELFNDNQRAHSLLNTTGAQLTYAPFRVLQIGVYVGGAEFDHDPSADDPDGPGFNANYSLTFGASGKIFTPGFMSDKLRGLLFGSMGFLKAEDGYRNVRQVFECHSGLGLQYQVIKIMKLGIGAEVYYLDGEQGNDSVSTGSNPFGNRDLYRGLISMEFYPKTNPDLIQGQPFICISFRFTGDMGWDENLGLKNGSLSITLGWITDFLYGKYKEEKEEE